MSFEAAAWAIKNAQVENTNQKMVLVVLADCHNAATGRCDPSIDFIATHSMMSRRTVDRCLGRLESLGIIQKTNRSNDHGLKTSSAYRLMISDASHSRIDASHSRIEKPDIKRQNHPVSPASADTSESRMQSSGSVTVTFSDASHSRINQEEENQEVNQGEARERYGEKFAPDDFEPDDSFRLIRHRRSDLDYETELIKFKSHEFRAPKTNWQKAWQKWWVSAPIENNRGKTDGGRKLNSLELANRAVFGKPSERHNEDGHDSGPKPVAEY